VRRVIVPPHPGLFSALGLLSTDLVFYASRSAYAVLAPETAPMIEDVFAEMERGLRERIGAEANGVVLRRSFDGRLLGQSWETPFVEVPAGPIAVPELIERFHAEYERRYGNRFEVVPVQGVTYRVELVVPAEKVSYEPRPGGATDLPPGRTVEIRHFSDEVLRAGEYAREELPVGACLDGPAVIREGLSTTFVCPGQIARVGRFGEIEIARA
jgi:N-methylhydantoinase A